MQNPLGLLFKPRQPSRHAAGVTTREPLDHPALIRACRAIIDDLPLPAYAIRQDGAVVILGES